MHSIARLRRRAPISRWLIAFWLVALTAIPFWAALDSAGWDVAIYYTGARSLMQDRNPYADAIVIQDAFHRHLEQHSAIRGLFRYDRSPFSYIYPPITLPLLHFFGALPIAVAGTFYWLLYCLCAVAIVWAGVRAAEARELQAVLFIAPAVFFFPGLLQNDTILSGNVAIIFYGLIVTGVVIGLRKGRWHWCYLAILLASCFKLPLLTLLALPLLLARRQLRNAAFTAATSLMIFAIQWLSAPVLFRNFLEAVAHQFAYIRDFGCSPAGLISNLLFGYGISAPIIDTLIYLAYAVPLFGLLWFLSREFFRGRFSLTQWFPVLMVGVILLNPRIMQYDTFALALPMGLITWRVLSRLRSRVVAVAIFCALLAGTSFCAVQSIELWWLTEGPLLVIVFAAGCWNLMHRRQSLSATEPGSENLESIPLRGRLAA